MDTIQKINTLREKYLSLANSVPHEKLDAKDVLIFDRLFSLPQYQEAKSIMTYKPYSFEVNVEKVLPKLFKEKRLGVPYMDNPKDDLHVAIVKDPDELNWGRLEAYEHPRRILEVLTPNKFDLILVPGLAFDRHGFRIGIGGHKYADLLEKAHQVDPNFNQKCIALAYEHQLVRKIPHLISENRVGKIITESRIIDCL